MKTLIEDLKKWFLGRKKHLKSFGLYDCRLESWFKGELFIFFDDLKRRRAIENFQREVRRKTVDNKRRQVDFSIIIKGEEQLCELKSLCISKRRTKRDLKFYFRDDNVGLIRDFRKLKRIKTKGTEKWLLAFIYPNPNNGEWKNQISSLSCEFKEWKCLTKPSDYPDFLFVALFHLCHKLK